MIRPYKSSDRESVIALLRLNTPTYFHPSEGKDFEEYLDHEAQHYYVVEEAGAITGCGGFNTGFDAGKTARISWDLIHPDYQRQGIGRKLTNFRIDKIRKHPETERIVVRTTQLVYKFYEVVGFRLVKTEKDFWADGFDLYEMVLDIRR